MSTTSLVIGSPSRNSKMLHYACALIFLLVGVMGSDGSCPKGCGCRNRAVYCTGRDGGRKLSAFPTGIPNDTVILKIHNNAFSTLPDDALANLPELDTLYISYNHISHLPATLFNNLPSLKYLFLDGNQISWLAEDQFASLTKLKQLNLHRNQISQLHENVFHNLAKLEKLYLDSNQIRRLPERIFTGLTYLTDLSLSHNPFESNFLSQTPRLFNALPRLKKLSIEDTRLTRVPEQVFDTQIAKLKLRTLYASDNQFKCENVDGKTQIPIGFQKLKEAYKRNGRYLDLRGMCYTGTVIDFARYN